jgi:hypothetical protein
VIWGGLSRPDQGNSCQHQNVATEPADKAGQMIAIDPARQIVHLFSCIQGTIHMCNKVSKGLGCFGVAAKI